MDDREYSGGNAGYATYCVQKVLGFCRSCAPDPVNNSNCPFGWRPVRVRMFFVNPLDQPVETDSALRTET